MNFTPKSAAIALLFAALPSFFAFSQTPQEVQKIIKDYNLPLLQEMENRFSEQAQREKAEAVVIAQQRGLETRMTLEDGGVAEVQRVLSDGTLIYYRTFNVDAARSTRTDHLNTGGSLGLNLMGQNMFAYVWDAGHARASHQEYHGAGGSNRYTVMDGTASLDFHAAHVTGTIMASGVVANAKGMAPHSRVRGYDWNNDLAEATTAAGNGMLISNHSYGFDASDPGFPDWAFGAYISVSRDWDALQYNAPFYLMVVAAGNDGTANYNGAPLDPNFPQYDKLTGHSTSKNNLVVASAQDANVNNNGDLISVNISSFSSQGPTDDYRIKPDITGNGQGVYSTYQNSNTAYNTISGTSMASPNVAGSLLLLQEHANNINGNYMRAATLKGLALHTADDAGMTGPDAIFGWGLMNAKRAAETLTANGTNSLVEELTLLPGQTYSITVDSDGINDLLASISWTDPAGTATSALNNTTPRLVNDLDIRVTQGATTYYPWRLTGVNTNANDGDNFRDPFERVDVTGASGSYTITVTHKGTLSGGSQNYSLIVTGITDVPILCNAPTNIIIDSITGSSVDFSWTASPSETLGYEWVIMNSGGNPDVDTPLFSGSLATGSTSVSISGLSPVTAYSFFIRANCDSDGFSQWAGGNFSTPCDTFSTFPFLETWEESSMTISCWSVQQVVGSGSWYLTNGEANGGNPTTAYSGSRNVRFESVEGTNNPISKLISPVFDFSGLPSAELNFFYAQEVWFGDQNELKVYYRISQSDPWVEIAHYTANTPAWTEETLQLPELSDTYQIAFEGINNWGRANVIDEVSIRFSGYIYVDGSWSPTNPEGVSTITDNVMVVNGTTTLSGETLANHLLIQNGAALRVPHTLRVNGDITNDGELIFVSDATTTGQLDTFTGTLTGTGEVTIERFIPARRAFRFLSSAVTTTGTINANWQEGATNATDDPNPGFGTHITGSTTGANGFDATPSGNYSLFTLNNPAQAWEAVTNTDVNTIAAGMPYRLMVRGDRSIDVTSNSAAPTNTTLRTTGNLHTGPLTITDLSSNAGGFNFFGNPYPAIVDMNQVIAASANINENHYYIWDPNMNTRGAYVTVDLDPLLPSPDQYLQPGQAAFVTTLASAPASLTFQESHKAVEQDLTQVFSVASRIDLRLFTASAFAQSEKAADGLRIKFNEEYTNEITPLDAAKFYNLDENLATDNNGSLLSIESRALPLAGESIPLFTNQYRTTDYIFEADLTEINDITALLVDNFTGTTTQLENNENTLYAFTINPDNPESIATDRFEIVFEELLSVNDESFGAGFVLFPNPAKEYFTIATRGISGDEVTVSITNVLGQTVVTENHTVNANGQLTINTNALTQGVYIVKLTHTNGGQFTTKMIKN